MLWTVCTHQPVVSDRDCTSLIRLVPEHVIVKCVYTPIALYVNGYGCLMSIFTSAKEEKGKKKKRREERKKKEKVKGKEKDSGPEAQKVGPERGAGAPARGQCGGLLEIGAFGVGRVAVLDAPV